MARWGLSRETLKPPRSSVLAGTKVPIKYRDPQNEANVWSGRGRAPRWFREALDAGVPVEVLIVRPK
nr:H-NS histone family protein [Rubellimicrobium aerolatum]